MYRGKEQFERENGILADHLKIESQIRKVEAQDAKKMKLIAKQAGVKIPIIVPCQMIDQKRPEDPDKKADQATDSDEEDVTHIHTKFGIPTGTAKNPNQQTTGVYFMSNEISQDIPIPVHLQEQVKLMHEALEINTFELHPSMAVSNMLGKINE